MTSWLITGGTGSLGQALTDRLLDDAKVMRLAILSRDELKQAYMAERFTMDAGRLRFFLGDVRDEARLVEAFSGVETVVHAAALKRVDAVAYNPREVVQTNVYGTGNVCRAAIAAGVRKVLFISSDKAVEPTNIYGATKMMGEHIVTGSNVYGAPKGTIFSSLRYGNVLASRGSVIERWRDAQTRGEMCEITEPTMTRFWLTLSQASEFVVTVAGLMEGGEVFVPKLKSADLVTLYRATQNGRDNWRSISIRPGGEKMHESLLSQDELRHTEDRGYCYVVRPEPHPWRGDWPVGTDVVPSGFRYSSDLAERLTTEEIKAMLAQ